MKVLNQHYIETILIQAFPNILINIYKLNLDLANMSD